MTTTKRRSGRPVRPAAATGEKPAGATGEKPAGATGGKPAGATGGKPAGATAERPAGATGKKPAGERRPVAGALPVTDGEARMRGCCAVLEPGSVTEAERDRLVADLETLAHPIRLRLLAALAANPGRVCVCDLEAIVPVKQPTVSHHLRILRQAGLVESEREGLWAYYRLRAGAMREVAGRLGSVLAILSGDQPVNGGNGNVRER